MNTGIKRTKAEFNRRRFVSARRVVTSVLAAMLLSACGQEAATESAGSNAPAAAPPASKALVTDAAIRSAQKAVESAEQRALAQSVRISGEVEKSATEKEQETARALEAASKKTDEMLRQAAADAAAAKNH